jgi:hypothetical protein
MNAATRRQAELAERLQAFADAHPTDDAAFAPLQARLVSEVLGRSANEKAMLVIPVGYPASGAQVPDLARKSLEEISVWA